MVTAEEILLDESSKEKTIWSDKDFSQGPTLQQTRKWNFRQITVTKVSLYDELMILSTIVSNFQNAGTPLYGAKLVVKKKSAEAEQPVAFDSIRFDAGRCKAPQNCDFDQHLCGYESSGDVPIQVGDGRLYRPSPGLKTFRAATRFAYVDWTAVNFNTDTKKVVLTSDISTRTNDHCLSFKYFANGDDDALQINRIGSKGRWGLFKEKLVLQNQATQEVTVTGNDLFRLEFEITLKKDKPMFFAIDDITVTEKACKGDTPTPPPEISAPDRASCNFDNGMCYWKNLYPNRNDGGMWIASDKDTRKEMPWLPRADHTTGVLSSGHYLYASAFKDSQLHATLYYNGEQKPDVLIKNILPVGDVCLSLWYVLQGHKTTKLHVS